MRLYLQNSVQNTGVKLGVYTKPPFVALYDGKSLCVNCETLAFNGAIDMLRYIRKQYPQYYDGVVLQIRQILKMKPDETA